MAGQVDAIELDFGSDLTTALYPKPSLYYLDVTDKLKMALYSGLLDQRELLGAARL